jgi:hypothetical protein
VISVDTKKQALIANFGERIAANGISTERESALKYLQNSHFFAAPSTAPHCNTLLQLVIDIPQRKARLRGRAGLPCAK